MQCEGGPCGLLRWDKIFFGWYAGHFAMNPDFISVSPMKWVSVPIQVSFPNMEFLRLICLHVSFLKLYIEDVEILHSTYLNCALCSSDCWIVQLRLLNCAAQVVELCSSDCWIVQLRLYECDDRSAHLRTPDSDSSGWGDPCTLNSSYIWPSCCSWSKSKSK